MKIYELGDALPTSAQRQLFDFEQQFVYPLGQNSSFRIDHGSDYTAFYRAIGDPTTLAAEIDGKIIGVISIAIRNICINGATSRFAYIGDLKIDPAYQSGSILFRLVKFVQPQLTRAARYAYCVVMDGTSRAPSSYSGRIGIPLFDNVSKLHILRITTSMTESNQAITVSAEEGVNAYRRLNAGGTILDIANSSLRSEASPTWLVSAGRACGLVEDTRRSKRLYLSDGTELLSAHLSYFSFCDSESALSLLNGAVNWAFENGFPAVFVGLSPMQKRTLQPVLDSFQCQESMATIYATDDICSNIAINSSEI
jgi:hypothetical protein